MNRPLKGEAVRQDCVVIWCKGYQENRCNGDPVMFRRFEWIQRTFIHATYWEVGALLIGNGSARSVHSVVGAGNRSAC